MLLLTLLCAPLTCAQSTLQDLALLTQQHSHQWLTLVGSQEKEVYLQQSSHIMDLLSR